MERTLSIIKPNAVAKNVVGDILKKFEELGLDIIALKMVHMRKKTAEGFYSIHREKPFFNSLIEFMISGPVIVTVLEGENAIEKARKIIGHTDPSKAETGTIRKKHGESIQDNAVHGSDSPKTAEYEINYFFNALEQHSFHQDCGR